MKSFGDEVMLLEKFVVDPRHVEVQVWWWFRHILENVQVKDALKLCSFPSHNNDVLTPPAIR
jgi:hypothetical protein